MVVHDLPLAIHLAPHVREPRLDWSAVLIRARHEGVHASVQIRFIAEALDVICRDCAAGESLEEVHEVLLGGLLVTYELGRDSGEEGQIRGGVEQCDLLEVLLQQRVVPRLEVRLDWACDFKFAVTLCFSFEQQYY